MGNHCKTSSRTPDEPSSTFSLFFIPILFGLDFIFEWLDPEVIANDYLVQKTSLFKFAIFLFLEIFFISVFFQWLVTIIQRNLLNKTMLLEKILTKLQYHYRESHPLHFY